jgi:hypothetical protein
MKAWKRAAATTPCGGPCGGEGGQIEPGEPILVITIPGIDRVTFRCRRCAGDPVPDDLTAAPTRARQAAPLDMTRLDALAGRFDFKKIAAGREPGEEG